MSKFSPFYLIRFFLIQQGRKTSQRVDTSLQKSHKSRFFHNDGKNQESGLLPVKKPRSILGQRTSHGCLSLACGIEGGTGWVCSEDTLWVGGWAACCGYFGTFEMLSQCSGSGRYHGNCDLAGVESFGGPLRWHETPEDWSCSGDEEYRMGKGPQGSWPTAAGSCRTRVGRWVPPVWARSRQTCTPGAALLRLGCRQSLSEPGMGYWRDREVEGEEEEEGRRRDDSRNHTRLASYQGRVSCKDGGDFLKSRSPLKETQRKRGGKKYRRWAFLRPLKWCSKVRLPRFIRSFFYILTDNGFVSSYLSFRSSGTQGTVGCAAGGGGAGCRGRRSAAPGGCRSSGCCHSCRETRHTRASPAEPGCPRWTDSR